MKRALGILGVIALTAGVTWLAARWQVAEERADRLDHALRDAEARANQLQGDIEAANERLAELRQKQELALHPPISHSRTVITTSPVSRSTTLQENKTAVSVEIIFHGLLSRTALPSASPAGQSVTTRSPEATPELSTASSALELLTVT